MWTLARIALPKVDVTEYRHVDQHVKIHNRVVTMCILAMIKEAQNHPIYWRLRWCLFHIVMGSKFLLWEMSNKFSAELSLHACSVLCPIQSIAKPLVYWGTIFYVVLLCTMTPNVKKSKEKKVNYCLIQGFCISK